MVRSTAASSEKCNESVEARWTCLRPKALTRSCWRRSVKRTDAGWVCITSRLASRFAHPRPFFCSANACNAATSNQDSGCVTETHSRQTELQGRTRLHGFCLQPLLYGIRCLVRSTLLSGETIMFQLMNTMCRNEQLRLDGCEQAKNGRL